MQRNGEHVPDFLIVGAMKSGTTSLHHILAHHPRVFIPPSEIFFFDLDDIEQHYDYFIYNKRGQKWHAYDFEARFAEYWQWYVGHFATALPDQLVGEDSTTYLASQIAPQRLAQHLPHAKIIILLRDPIERAWSHYGHLMESRRAIYTFEDTIMNEPHTLLQRGFYARQIAHWLSYFPREQVHILLFEAFIQDMQAHVDRLCDFLGLTERIDTQAIPTWSNKTTYPRFVELQLAYNRLLRPITSRRFLIETTLPNQQDASSRPRPSRSSRLIRQMAQVDRALVRLNAGKRPPMKAETRQFLQDLYRRENRSLAELTALPIHQHWQWMQE
ncbi:MAG: sulfotransferase family protein [Phototrophicaceae bacterium]